MHFFPPFVLAIALSASPALSIPVLDPVALDVGVLTRRTIEPRMKLNFWNVFQKSDKGDLTWVGKEGQSQEEVVAAAEARIVAAAHKILSTPLGQIDKETMDTFKHAVNNPGSLSSQADKDLLAQASDKLNAPMDKSVQDTNIAGRTSQAS